MCSCRDCQQKPALTAAVASQICPTYGHRQRRHSCFGFLANTDSFFKSLQPILLYECTLCCWVKKQHLLRVLHLLPRIPSASTPSAAAGSIEEQHLLPGSPSSCMGQAASPNGPTSRAIGSDGWQGSQRNRSWPRMTRPFGKALCILLPTLRRSRSWISDSLRQLQRGTRAASIFSFLAHVRIATPGRSTGTPARTA